MLKRFFAMLLCSAMIVAFFPLHMVKAQEADYTAQQWKPAEISLTSTVDYANAFRDVELNAVFTHEDGTAIAIPGYWNGGKEWKVRFSPTKTGKWSFSISCSNDVDTGLFKTGTLMATANTGNTQVDKKGFVRLETGKRYFVYDDGTPFYWLGDTHWQMFDNEYLDKNNYPGTDSPSEFEMLLKNRLDKGFTVYQTYPDSAEKDGGGNTRRYRWWKSVGLINPTAFNENYDVMMSKLAESGMTVAMGLGVHANTTKNLSENNLLAYTRYVVARYACYNVVWITGQEITSDLSKDKVSYNTWKKVGALIDALDGYKHPQGAHMYPHYYKDVKDLDEQPWHQWWTLQAGHGGTAGIKGQDIYKSFFDSPSQKPYLETEANYEDIYCGGFTGYDASRICAWKANQCGSYGFTYGGVGIWALRYDTTQKGWTSYNPEPWYAGLDKPGSFEMTYMKNFYTTVGFQNLIPRFNNGKYGSFSDGEKSVISTDENATYVVYFYNSTVKTGKLYSMDENKVYTAYWYNNKTGKYILISNGFKSEKGIYNIPEKPNTSDWVLLVTNKNLGIETTEGMPYNFAAAKTDAQPTGQKLTVTSYKNISSTKAHDINLAFDNDPSTYWMAFATRVSNTIIMDLGEKKTLGFVRFVYPKVNNLASQTYRIDVSDNGSDWTIAVDRTARGIIPQTPSGKQNAVVNEEILVQGRYVRLINIGSNDTDIPVLGEIELYEGDASKMPVPTASPIPMATDAPVITLTNVDIDNSTLPLPIVAASLLAIGFLSFGAGFGYGKNKKTAH